MNGAITHIQRYSIHDGPGIRTVVFFKGCPLSCLWCCNPETQSFQPELEFRQSLCQRCGRCVEICPLVAINKDLNCQEREKINRNLCNLCGQCVEVCPSGSLNSFGENWSLQEVMKEIVKDNAYYRRSGGGITLSGGEPLSQPQFAFNLLSECFKRNIHTTIETCGEAPRLVFEQILPVTSLFLFDIKHLDSDIHQKLTGVRNKTILNNLHWLAEKKVNIILRIPLIPGMNSKKNNIMGIAKLAKEIGIIETHIMPFHQMGKDKYQQTGRDYSMQKVIELRLSPKGKEVILATQKILEDSGLIVFVGG